MGRTTGLWRFRPTETGVAEEIGIPKAIAITGNSPNPFNPSTSISFSLPAPSHVSLAVYDITGRKVRTLVSGQMSEGEHTATWDGRDDSGQPVASGMYISRLVAGERIAAGKMALVK
jgi:flagellar hook assembly protein FlgD